jgi:hypothetical protein
MIRPLFIPYRAMPRKARARPVDRRSCPPIPCCFTCWCQMTARLRKTGSMPKTSGRATNRPVTNRLHGAWSNDEIDVKMTRKFLNGTTRQRDASSRGMSKETNDSIPLLPFLLRSQIKDLPIRKRYCRN